MKTRIITLSENTPARDGFIGEYGLSVLIERGSEKILFDTGQGTACVRNADLMGVKLDDIGIIILSHGHYDHTGGLKSVLHRTGRVDVYAHPDIFCKRYAIRGDHKRSIGIPFERSELEALGARFILSRDPVHLNDIIISGEIKRQTAFELPDPALFIEDQGTLKPDPFADDQAIAIKTSDGLIIILGCAHSGMVNTIAQLIELTREDRIHTIIGGTHLMFAEKRQIEASIKYLKSIEVGKIGVSHCTGHEASNRLKEAFGDRFFMNNAGSVIEI
ncbi:MAG: beta-lactamase domain-containing protein [Candidatus Syntrophoarchaeum caldarius]|uniref:Beta-lactamase domain-containing protein n=1 Tax=Candidatus Syntropharchaeum caldarium TaxID=1838285 RepID=A0A1F2PBS5_9EURY|nr:MAG: beta-lactamase domain-containing protein [Candidatus Syntrophoarchaeum caldarius]